MSLNNETHLFFLLFIVDELNVYLKLKCFTRNVNLFELYHGCHQNFL